MEQKDPEIENAEKELEKFDDMEKTFHRVIQDLIADHSFDHFREEYEKLHTELLSSHANNQTLIEQCKGLNNSILANANKISSVLTLSQNDQRTIAGLRHEFEKAWKMVELSQDREEKSKEAIDNLKMEISNLSRLVEQGGAAAFTQEASLQDVSDQIIVLKKEIPVQIQQIDSMKKQVAESQSATDDLRNQIVEMTNEQVELNKNMEESRTKNLSAVDETEKIMIEIIETKNQIKEQQKHSEDLNEKIANKKFANKELELGLQDEHLNVKSADEDLQANLIQVKQGQNVLEIRQKQAQKIIDTTVKQTAVFEKHNQNWQFYRQKLDRIMEERTDLQEELADLKTYWKEIDQDRSKHRNRISECNNTILRLVTEFNTQKNDNQTQRFKIERGIKEGRDLSSKHGLEKQTTIMVENQTKLVTADIMGLKGEQHDFRAKVASLDNETTIYEDRAIEAKNGNIHIKEEIRIRETQIDVNTLTITDLHGQIKHQGTMIETVQNERDVACRLCQEAFKDNSSMAESNDILSKQIRALKDEIREKDRICVETHYKQKTILRQVITLSKQNAEKKAELKEMDMKTTELRNLMTRSQFLLTSSDLEMMKQKQGLNEIKASSDVMEKMTVRHVNEKAKLLVKANLLKHQIAHGKTAFNKQTEVIESYKQDLLHDVETYKSLLTKNRHGKALKLEIIRVQKSLVEMMGRSRALEEEIEKPMNVHRWRFLDATNPESAQLIRMNVALRDRLMILISRLERIMNTKRMLEDRALIEERHLQNSYGGQYDDELAYYAKILREKNRMLEQMKSKASSQRNYVLNTREQVMTVRTMVREEKTELYESKKRCGQQQQTRAKTSYGNQRIQNFVNPANKINVAQKTEIKFVGGGFAVGGIKTPTQQQRMVRPQTRQNQQILTPALVLPQNATPRRPKSNLTNPKQTPRGWNPNRQPLSPYLQTANGTGDF